MSRLLRLLLLILCGAGCAHGWFTSYGQAGDQRANAVVQDRDGDFTFAGRTTLPNKWRGDLLLVHVDSLGRELWRRSTGTKRGDEDAYALLQLGDAGYLVAGCRYRHKTRPKGPVTGLVQAFSASGEPSWSREFEDVEIKAAIAFQDGILLGGRRKERLDSGWLCLMDARGAVRWTRDCHPADSSRVDALAALSDSTFVLAGQWKSAADQRCAAWCAVADASGSILHEYRSGVTNGFFRSVATQGGFITCGGGIFTLKSVYNNDYDSVVLRADLQCLPLDSLRFKGKGLDYIMALDVTDSTIVCTGVTALDPALPDSRPGVQFLSLDKALKTRWRATQSGITGGMGKAILILPDGCLIAGLVNYGDKLGSDAMLIRATASGLVETGVIDSSRVPVEEP